MSRKRRFVLVIHFDRIDTRGISRGPGNAAVDLAAKIITVATDILRGGGLVSRERAIVDEGRRVGSWRLR